MDQVESPGIMAEADKAAEARKTSYEVLESTSKKLSEIIAEIRGARIQQTIIGESMEAVKKALDQILFARALINEEKTVDDLTCGS